MERKPLVFLENCCIRSLMRMIFIGGGRTNAKQNGLYVNKILDMNPNQSEICADEQSVCNFLHSSTM
jgi:hypothetical protein